MTDQTALSIATAAINGIGQPDDPERLAAAVLAALRDHYMDDDETASYLAAVIESDREIDRAREDA
jgi:hypothetical protein